MTSRRHRPTSAPGPNGRRAGARRSPSRFDEGGFVLLETIVTVSLITIIMAALATFFLNAIASTNQQRARQTATQVADTAVGKLHGLPASDLVSGRDTSGVSAQFTAASTTVQPWLAAMERATDAGAAPGSGTTAAVPTVATSQTVNKVVYAVSTYLGWCGVATGSQDCTVAAIPTGTTYLRAVVAVSWRDKVCANSSCNYLTATLISTSDDPTFNLYQTPPPAPFITDPGTQNSVVGEAVSLQLALAPNSGVPPHTWQVTGGALPAGLGLNPAGQISGMPTTEVTNQSVTVTVTDAFLRTSSRTFLWTIVPPLTIAAPGNQASTRTVPISPLTLTASGGAGPPYVWSDPTNSLPPGLTLTTVSNQGQVTGTPTAAGTFTVQLAVKDATTTRTTTVSFSWVVVHPPFSAATPSDPRSTVSRAISPLQLTTAGGSGSSTWSGGGTLPAGLSLTAGGLITGTPTATGTPTVQLVVNDTAAGQTRNVTFTWTVFAAPTLAALANQTVRPTEVVQLQLATTCPNLPCTYTILNGPATLTVNSTGRITGTITSGLQVFPTTTINVQDRAGATVTTAPFSWTVTSYPAVVNATAGLLSYWRLGEPAATLSATDSFNSAGSLLTSRTAETGGAWLTLAGSSNVERISSVGHGFRSGTGYAISYLPATPPTASYSTEADLVVRSVLTGDSAGVVARVNTGQSNTFYLARWEDSNKSWNIIRSVNGTASVLGFVAAQPALNAGGTTYRLRLETIGSGGITTLRLFVNGVLTVGPVDDPTAELQEAGNAGIMDGLIGGTAGKTGDTGLHFENFQVTPATYPRAVDSKGTNTGDYKNGATIGVPGIPTGDANTAADFDGMNDYVQAATPTGLPTGAGVRSVELWFKTISAARQVLFDYGTRSQDRKFALWLNAGGNAMTGWGFGAGSDKNFVLPNAVNDGNWHQVVTTYDGTTLRVYVDSVLRGTSTAVRDTILDPYGFNVGAIVTPSDGNSGGFFDGSLDEVSFYTTALSPEEIARHYQLGSLTPSSAGPSGGFLRVNSLINGVYAASTSLNLTFSAGTDPDGIASGAELRRATGTLTSASGTAEGVCGALGAYALVATNPVSGMSNPVADQACYRYQYRVQDALGNTTTYTGQLVKVDRTAPATPALVVSALTNSYWPGGASTQVFYRGTQPTGKFTVTATSTDTGSGISGYTFAPAPGTNWVSTSGGTGVVTYSWVTPPAAPAPVIVSARNFASATADVPLTITPDDAAPTAGTISYLNGSTGSTSVSVSFTTGTDDGSGVASRLLQRSSAPLTSGACGTFSAFTTVVGGTDPASPLANAVVLGNCYRYQYVVTDRLGNAHTATSASTVRTESYAAAVKSTAGLLSHWRLGEPAGTPAIAVDAFTDTAGTALGSHAARTGGTWINTAPALDPMKISTKGRAYRDGAGYSRYHLPASPPTADYAVEADLAVESVVAQDVVGITARVNPAIPNTFYFAVWEQADTSWSIGRYINGNLQWLKWIDNDPAMVAGQSYKVRLEVTGNAGNTTLSLYVNGVLRVGPIQDNAPELQGAGKGGIMTAHPGNNVIQSDTTGLHFDSLQIVPVQQAVDVQAVNPGDYRNEVTRGVAGALIGDPDTAAAFDGMDDHVQVTTPAGLPLGASGRSVELWFKTSSAARQVFFDYGNADIDQKFALWLEPGNSRLTAWGYGLGSDKFFNLSAPLNDGAWHHIVKTYDGTSITVYVDGIALPSQPATRATTQGPHGFVIGTVLHPFDQSSGGYFDGSIDEVAVYTAALSPDVIANHYRLGKP